VICGRPHESGGEIIPSGEDSSRLQASSGGAVVGSATRVSRGGTLVSRAQRRRSLGFRGRCAGDDPRLTHIEQAPAPVSRSAPAVTFRARSRERDPRSAIPSPVDSAVRLCATWGTIGWQLFRPTPVVISPFALLALDATVSVAGGYARAKRRSMSFLAARDRLPASLVLSISFQPRPAPTRFAIANRADQAERPAPW